MIEQVVEFHTSQRCRGLESATTGRYGKPDKDRPILRREQFVRPTDRGAKCLEAIRKVARGAPQHLEPPIEQPVQGGRRENPQASRRQLQRQRQPVEASADLGEVSRVLGRNGEPWIV